MKFTPEEAQDALKKIALRKEVIGNLGTPGVLMGEKDGDIAIWFSTWERDRGVLFPITREQAVQFRVLIQQALDSKIEYLPKGGSK